MTHREMEPWTPEPLAEQATVFIVDHDLESRESVRVLAASAGLNAAACASASEFLEQHDPQIPGCLVSEVILPEMTGLELQKRLSTAGRSIPIIFTTTHGEVSTATKAMQAGAIDFLVKPVSENALLESIHQAIAVNRQQRHRQALRHDLALRMAKLTNRQREVMRLLSDGASTKDIAAQLGLSPKTVDNHRACVLRKMGARNVAQLVRQLAEVESFEAEDAA